MKVLGRTVRFGDPTPADVVIFDEAGADELKQAINPKHRIAVFPIRPEVIWVGPRVAAALVRLLVRINPASVRSHSRGVVRGLLNDLRGSYLQASLEAMHPKCVVTFIDNSSEFAWLSRRCKRFPLVAVQGGTRLAFAAVNEKGYYLQHLFSFGQREAAEFPGMNYTVKRYHPVGSLRASLHWNNGAKAGPYDLVVVSTWRGNIGYPRDVDDMMRSMRTMDELLAEYLRERRLRGAILLRAEPDGEHWFMPEIGMNEAAYYTSIYGSTADIIEPDFVTRNVYPVMRSGRVVVSCLSTAALEAFGWGKKVLYCNYTDTDEYHVGLDPAIVTTDASREGLFARLDALLETPQAEYEAEHRARRRYYIANPNDVPTHIAIANGIDAIIAEARIA